MPLSDVNDGRTSVPYQAGEQEGTIAPIIINETGRYLKSEVLPQIVITVKLWTIEQTVNQDQTFRGVHPVEQFVGIELG